ncbi:hypothetical protein V8C86DRAFT_715049 [Haematococcus lacustris]
MAAPSPDDPNALGSDGLPKFAHTTSQTFGGKKSTVAQVYNQLKGCTVRANYVVRISLIKKLVVIACLLCNKELGIINPTDSQCKHDEHCAMRARPHSPPTPKATQGTSAKRKGAPMEQHDVAKKMVMFVASAGVTFACLDNPFLRAVFASFDAVCPTAKQARTTGLRDAYGELCRVVGAELDEMLQNGVGVMLCTDGWRHKHAALGQPLVNLVLLKPSGGAIFHNVYTLDLGLSKTKQFYVDLHNRMANEVKWIANAQSCSMQMYMGWANKAL